MNFKNRQNISDNEFNIVREILGYNSIDESIRNITGYGENKKDEKRLVTPAIPDTPTKIAKKAKNDADDISVKENADNATKSTVIENIRNKFLSGITTLSLLAASPGNASDNLSTIKNINQKKKLCMILFRTKMPKKLKTQNPIKNYSKVKILLMKHRLLLHIPEKLNLAEELCQFYRPPPKMIKKLRFNLITELLQQFNRHWLK